MSDSIWFRRPSLEDLSKLNDNTAARSLGIEITELGDDCVRGTMPADVRTFQPMGLIHGGASVVLAETLGSIGANLAVDNSQYYCVGQEINANHLRGVRQGVVTGTARPLHMGRTSQVWEIKIENEDGKLTCVSRLTMAVIPHSR